jgi:hypothetical protein
VNPTLEIVRKLGLNQYRVTRITQTQRQVQTVVAPSKKAATALAHAIFDGEIVPWNPITSQLDPSHHPSPDPEGPILLDHQTHTFPRETLEGVHP